MTPWITKPVPFNIGQGAAAAATPSGCQGDFCSDYDDASDWTQISTGIDVDTTVEGACACRTGGGDGTTNREVYQDIGLTLSNTTWVSDSEFMWISNAGNNSSIPYLLATASGQFNAVKNIGWQEQLTVTKLYLQDYNTSVQQTAYATVLTASEVYYPRLTRLTATSSKLNIFTAGYGDTELGTPITHTIDSVIQSLDTLNHGNNKGENTSSTRNWDITQTQVWDGVTVPP
jgi:hypothetical protein